jgi:magnesium chelatase family protein
MVEKIIGCALSGLKGQKVDIEVNVSRGAKFLMVGLPDNAVKESHYRIAAALKNIGFKIPIKEIIINLAPADLKKEGSAYDLPIALGILSASNQIISKDLNDFMIMGELSLDGEIRPIKGALSMAIKAKEMGAKGIVIPYENISEASLVKDIKIIGAKTIIDVVNYFCHNKKLRYEKNRSKKSNVLENSLDFSDVIGQQLAKRAIEIAASGGHNILMIGPPGSGKSMLATRIPSILPLLTEKEMLETTMIYSYLGKFNHHNGLINNAPFRSPHHTISDVALVGGGTNPKPGEVSLAHNGVLFLDELPEFKRKVLEVLRQPLENREITISRSIGSVTFPSNIMLVAAMNPSPDGDYFRYAHSNQSFTQVQRYLSRLSQPLLDRIDLQIEVDAVKFEQLTQQKNENEKSCIIRQRVINARKTQKLRQSKNNAQLSPIELKRYCNLNKESIELLKKATLKQHFSARGFTRLQKIARTIADLDRSSSIEINHVAEALQYRGIEKMKNFLN